MTENLTVEEQEEEQQRLKDKENANKMMRRQANNEIYVEMKRAGHEVFKNIWHKEFVKREHIIWKNIDCEKFDTYFEGARKLILKLYKEEKEIEENYKNVKSYTGLKIGHKKPMVIPDHVKECLNSKLPPSESTAGGGRNRKTKRNKNLCRGKSVKRPNKCKKVKGCKVAKGKKRTYCRKAHNKRRVTSKKR